MSEENKNEQDVNTESNNDITQRQELRNQAYVKENLTPWEQKMMGMTDEPQEQETVEQEPSKEENASTEVEENKSPETTKQDAKAILEKLLKGEKEEDVQDEKKPEVPKENSENEEDDSDPVTKENRELKIRLQIIEETEKIEELLSNYSEKESSVLKDRLVELLGSPIYGSLHKLPTDEKIASLITMAKGLASDEIKAIAEETAETKTLLRDATSTPNGKNKQENTEEVRLKQLQEAARAGDRNAMIELQKYDPILNKLSGN